MCSLLSKAWVHVRKADEGERELRVSTCDVELNAEVVMPRLHYEDGNYELQDGMTKAGSQSCTA